MKLLGLSIKFILATSLLLATFVMANAQAQVYNSIPKPLPANVPSEGPEAYAFQEIGDGIQLAPTEVGGTLHQVKVIMSSWACQTGNWTAGCVTAPGATFSQPLTLKVYDATNLNTLLGTFTQTFDIPYRPSSTGLKCGNDNTAWYSAKEKGCFHGLAVPVQFNVADAHLVVPGKLIVTISFNTTSAGPTPTWAPCRDTLAGCPYDSLNIATFGVGGFDRDGSPMEFDAIYFRRNGLLQPETGYAGYHPEIHVLVNGDLTSTTKGQQP